MALKLNPYVLPTGSDFLRGSKIAKQNEGIPIFGNGILGNVAGGFGSSFLGGLGDAVNFIGFNNVADVLHRGGDYFEERLKPAMPAEFSLNYLTSPEGLARGVGNLTGSIASIAAPTLAVPESAFATGANLLSKLPMLGRLGASTLKMGLRGGLTAPMEASMEAGNYIENAIARGEDPEIARQKARDIFGKNTVFLALSNFGQWGLASKILNGTGWKNRLLAAAIEPHIQAVEEGEQQAFQNAAEGKPYSYNPFNWTNPQYASQGQAALEGYLPSAFLAGLGFTGGSIFGNRNRNSQNENPAINPPKVTPPQPSPTETPANTENPKSQGKGGATIDQFMGAISGQESGGDYNAENERTAAAGKYQILPTNWASWAQDAGLSPDAPMTPENQEIVAKNKMLEYYKEFGNWRDVAIAWYAGDGEVRKPHLNRDVPQGNGDEPSINEYADSVMSRLEKIAGNTEGESQPQLTGNIYTGENGKAEGKYWNRQTSNVSTEGLQPQGLNALDMLGKWFYEKTGKPLILTSGTDGKSHTDGEHSHYNGWKFDVNDWDGNSDGFLVTADGSKGTLTDEFIAYGRSLGLGMNWEGDHVDVALDGTQWDGNGENAGGFNPEKIQTSGKTQTPPPATNEENQTPKRNETIDNIIRDLLNKKSEPLFNSDAEDELTQNIYSRFAENKNTNPTGEDLAKAPDFFEKFFDDDGKFKNTKENRKAVAETFGDEFKNFGQEQLNSKIADYKNFLQTRANPLSEEVEKLTSHLENLKQNFDHYRNFETPDESVLSNVRDEIFKTSRERDKKLNQLAEIQKLLQSQPENIQSLPEEIQPVQKPTFTLKQGAKENKFDKFLIELLENNPEPQFNPSENSQLMKNIIAQFAYDKKKDDSLQDFFKGMFKRNGKKLKFQNTEGNRQKIIDNFGDELQTFGQQKLNERIANFNQRYDVQTQPAEIIQPAGNLSQQEIQTTKNIFPANSAEEIPSQPTLQNYQVELNNLRKQIKAEQKKLSKAIDSKDTAAVADSTKNIQTLQQQISDKNTQIENFKKSPEYAQQINSEIANLESMRDNISGILNSGVQDNNLYKQYDALQKEILSRTKELQELQQPQIQEKNPAIQKIGAKYVVSGGRNPNPAINLAEEIGGKYIAKDNNFAFESQQAAQNFLQRRGEVENAPSGDYNSAGIYGKDETVETSGGSEISVRYKIVPNESLNKSHVFIDGAGVFKNPSYPQELQPRNRESKALQAQVVEMANNLKPRKVGESIYLNEGAPITREDGVILNGNARSMAIDAALHLGKAENYRKFLIDNAEKFGFKAEEISQIKNPVLVREVAEKLDAETLNEIIKSGEGGAVFSSSELAKSDVDAIKLEDFADYQGGDLILPSNRNFVNSILNRVAKSTNAQNQYRDKDGNLNSDAVRRVKRAIFSLAYDNDDLVSKMAESIDDDIKNISKAAENSAVDFAKLKLKQREGLADEYDIGGVVADAIQAYENAKHDKRFKTVGDFINQDRQNLFDERQRAIYDAMEIFDEYKNSPQTLTDFLKDVAKTADRKSNPDQVSLNFGDDVETYKKAQIDEIVRAVRDKYLREIPSETDLFAENKRKAAEQAAREKMLAEDEKTESQKIYERGEKRARELFENPPEENNSAEENISDETAATQTEKNSSQTQSKEEFDSRQEKKNEEKPSIWREGNKFVVHVGEDVSNLKLGLLGTFLKGTDGKYRRGTKTFAFPKASEAMKFATNVEITKMNDDARQEMYRKAKVADFPILKPIFDAGYDNSQARETLIYLQNLPSRERGILAIQALLNTYRGDSEKLHKAENFLSKLEKGTQQEKEPIKFAYDKLFDMLYGNEIEDGETLPALPAPKNLLPAPIENISAEKIKSAEKKSESEKISEEKADKGGKLTAEEVEKKANALLKVLNLQEKSAPSGYISHIWLSNIRDGYVDDEIHVRLGYNDYKKVWKSIDKIGKKLNANIVADDNREFYSKNDRRHEYLFKNLDDARIFAKATQKLLRGIDGAEIKIHEELPTPDELRTQHKVFDEMKKVAKEKNEEWAKVGKPVNNLTEDTVEIPQERGVRYEFPKVKTGDKTWFYYPREDEFYDDETQDMYKPADDVLHNALEYFYNYGNAEKAAKAIELELKYDADIARHLGKTLEKSKEILLNEGKNWQYISPREEYGFDDEDYDETEEDFSEEIESEQLQSDQNETENKKAANTGEQDTSKAELAEGYKTESGRSLQDADRDEFILKPDGTKDFGQITDEVAKQSKGRLQASPIRLQVGFNRLLENGNYDGFGLLHIKKREESLKKLGYDSAENYLETIAQNYDKIYDISTEKKPNRFLITMHDEHYNVMPVDFIATSDGKSYTIVSALSKGLNRENKQKGTVLFDRSASLSSTSNSETAQNGNVSKNVGTDTQSATEKVTIPSAENISQSSQDGKAEFKSDEEIREEMKNNLAGVFERIDSRAIDILKKLNIKISKPLDKVKGKTEDYGYIEANKIANKNEGWGLVIFENSNLNGKPDFNLFNSESHFADDVKKIIAQFQTKPESADFWAVLDNFEEYATLSRALNIYFGNYEVAKSEGYDIGYYIANKVSGDQNVINYLNKHGAKVEDGKVVYPDKKTQTKIERTVAFMADAGAIHNRVFQDEPEKVAYTTVLDRALEIKSKSDVTEFDTANNSSYSRDSKEFSNEDKTQKIISQLKRGMITQDEAVEKISETTSREQAEKLVADSIETPKEKIAERNSNDALEKLQTEKINLPQGSQIKSVSIGQNAKGKWKVRVAGDFESDGDYWSILRQIEKAAKGLDFYLSNDKNFYFDDKIDATAFKQALEKNLFGKAEEKISQPEEKWQEIFSDKIFNQDALFADPKLIGAKKIFDDFRRCVHKRLSNVWI